MDVANTWKREKLEQSDFFFFFCTCCCSLRFYFCHADLIDCLDVNSTLVYWPWASLKGHLIHKIKLYFYTYPGLAKSFIWQGLGLYITNATTPPLDFFFVQHKVHQHQMFCIHIPDFLPLRLHVVLRPLRHWPPLISNSEMWHKK